jgi:hypothetical protein
MRTDATATLQPPRKKQRQSFKPNMRAMISRLKQREHWKEKKVGSKSIALSPTLLYTPEGFDKMRRGEAVKLGADYFDGSCTVYEFISNKGTLAVCGFIALVLCSQANVPLLVTISRNS